MISRIIAPPVDFQKFQRGKSSRYGGFFSGSLDHASLLVDDTHKPKEEKARESEDKYKKKLVSYMQGVDENIRNRNYLKAEEALLDVNDILKMYPHYSKEIRPMLDKYLNLLASIYLKDKMTDRLQVYRLVSRISDAEVFDPLDRYLYFFNLLSCSIEMENYEGSERALKKACELLQERHKSIDLKTGVHQTYTAAIIFVGKICENARFLFLDDREKQLTYANRLLGYLDPTWVDLFMDAPNPFLYHLSLSRCYLGIEQFQIASQFLDTAKYYLQCKTPLQGMAQCVRQINNVIQEMEEREVECARRLNEDVPDADAAAGAVMYTPRLRAF